MGMDDYPFRTDEIAAFSSPLSENAEAAHRAADDLARIFIKLTPDERGSVLAVFWQFLDVCRHCLRDLDGSVCHCENDE